MKFEYTKNCREISGFGSGYESSCRDMVIAGMKWLDENKKAKIDFAQYKNIYGLTFDESEDCKKMQEKMLAVNDGCSGAQMQACLNHIIYAYTNGWGKYIKEMEQNKNEKR